MKPNSAKFGLGSPSTSTTTFPSGARLALTTLALLTGAISARADVLAEYDFNFGGATTTVTAANLSTSPLFAPSATDASVTASNVTVGSGLGSITYVTNANEDYFQIAEANGMSDGVHPDGGDITTFMNAAYAAGDYIDFTLTADPGTELNLDSLTFDFGRATRGTNDFSLRTSVDGFTSYVALEDQARTTGTFNSATPTFGPIDLSDPSFQGLSSITFRITFDDRQNNNGGASATIVDDIVVNGTIEVASPTWQVDGDGDWSTPANWSIGVPNAAGAGAVFNDELPLSGPLTATLDVPVTLGDLTLSSAQDITIDGASALTLDGGGAAGVSASAGSHVISAAVSLTDPLGVNLAAGSALDLSGALSGTTSVTHSGGGQLTLSGDLSGHTGSIISDAGSLVMSGSSASDITVNAGSLDMSGTGVSDITVGTGVTLSGEGSHTGSLNLAADNMLSIDPVSAGALTTGTLSPTAPVTVDFTSSPLGLTDFTVLNYTTYGGAVATDFVSPDYRITFTDTLSSITATVAAAATSNWTGADDGGGSGYYYWDNGITPNWSSGDSLFYAGDAVTFTDTGVGFVDVAAEVAPATVTFTNTSGNNYSVEDTTANVETISAETGGINVTGDGDVTMNLKLTGNTSITHSGTGTLGLGGGGVNNDFVGTITVDGGGTLKNLRDIDKVNSLGDFANTFSFTNGSTFDLNSISAHRDYQSYGTGSFVFGDATTLTNSSASTANDAFSDQLDFAGDVTLDGVGRFDIMGDLAVTGTDIVITVENDAGAVINTSNTGKSIAEWVVNDGTLFASTGTSFGDAFITVNADGAITGNVGSAVDDGNGLGVANIANAITLNGGRLIANQPSTTSEYSGTVTVTAASAIDPNNATRTVILSGVLAESGSGGDLTIGDGTTRIASSLNATGFSGDFILNETGTFELENGVNLAQDIVVEDVGGNKVIQLSSGNSAEISGGITIAEADAEQFDLFVADGVDTLTVSGVISGAGAAGVTKTGAGTVVLSGVNSYTGETKAYAGVLSLGDGTNASELADSADVSLLPSATLDLNFVGTDQIDELLIDGVAQAGGTWGAIGSMAANESALITGTGFIEVLTAGGTPFSLWADSFAGLTDSDPDLDFEGDGLETGVEWVVGGDPTANDAATVAPTSSYTGSGLDFVFRRTDESNADTNTTIAVEYGSDLDGWADAVDAVDGVAIAVDDDFYGAGIDRVTVSLPDTLDVDGKLFARLNVTVVEPAP